MLNAANKLKMAPPQISEKVREKSAVHTLRWLGYEVRTLGKPVPTTCPKCHAFHWAHTTGNDVGVADVIVSHASWPSKTWKMLETKKSAKADRRREQVELAEAGFSTFFVTEEQAIRAVIDVEQKMGLAPNPRLLSWLEQNVRRVDPGTAVLLAGDTPNAAWRP